MTTEGYDPKTTIFPTFECFSDAMDFIEHIGKYCPEKIDHIRLVHAICVNQEGGVEYAHGWVEDIKQDVCIFSGVYMGETVFFAVRPEEFFKHYIVKESTRYTVREAVDENIRTVNYGPWEEKYIALCGKGGTVLGGGQMENVGLIGSLPTKTETKEGTQNESNNKTN